jgi:hypothetical protein
MITTFCLLILAAALGALIGAGWMLWMLVSAPVSPWR